MPAGCPWALGTFYIVLGPVHGMQGIVHPQLGPVHGVQGTIHQSWEAYPLGTGDSCTLDTRGPYPLGTGGPCHWELEVPCFLITGKVSVHQPVLPR